MTERRYELETVKQMLDVVNEENLQDFLEDFGTWLNLRCHVKKMLLQHPEVKIQVKDAFIWIEDGKHEANVNIEVKSKVVQ